MESVELSQKRFQKLSAEVNAFLGKQSWLELFGKEWRDFFIRAVIIVLGFFIFRTQGVIFKAVGLFVISYGYFGMALTGTHGTSHFAFARSKKFNKGLAYFFSDFLAAQSNKWWYYRHVRLHHAHTNAPEEANVGEFMYPWLNKWVYFFVIPWFAVGWMIAHSVAYLWGKWSDLLLYLGSATAGFAAQFALFWSVVPAGYALLCTYIMRSLFAPVFMHMAVFNHIGLEMPRPRALWMPHQTKTTRNLKHNWFLDFMGGHAFTDCHLEHHLFPGLSNNMLRLVSPLVESHINQANYGYIEEGYFTLLFDCLRNYDALFRGQNAD